MATGAVRRLERAVQARLRERSFERVTACAAGRQLGHDRGAHYGAIEVTAGGLDVVLAHQAVANALEVQRQVVAHALERAGADERQRRRRALAGRDGERQT